MNETIQQAIFAKIQAYNRLILCRHLTPDGDAVGSTLGFAKILRATYPEKEIYLANDDRCGYAAFLGEEGPAPAPSLYDDALVLVLDTGSLDRVSNRNILLAKEIIKIDHHPEDPTFGTLGWVEEDRSSTCEMITAFYDAFRDRLIMTPEAAACLFCGMVTDTGRFRFRGTGPETLRCAALLLEQGFDTDVIYSNLYMNDYDSLIQRAKMTELIQMTPNGVAWLFISADLRRALGCTLEEAGGAVSLMESLKGSLIWIAFIENDDGSTRVRLRSRFVTVQEIASHYHGGGHPQACGATVYSEEEKNALLAEADAWLGNYKAQNEGWL